MYRWLKDAISPHAVVITASRRLARHLRSAYADQQLAAGRLSWQTPSIFFFGDWCQRQLETIADPGALPVPIDRFSSAILWERCIKEQDPGQLPAISGIVRQAREAWRRLNDWNVALSAVRESARSPDEQAFAAAATAYQACLEAGRWVDREGVLQLVIGSLEHGRIGVPQEATLAGFDRYSPAVTAVMDALAVRGCNVHAAPDAGPSTDLSVVDCADHDAEMRTAGAWARDILQRSPAANVVIVSPLLQGNAERAVRLVREGVAPGWQYAGASWRSAVNVSYGRNLSDYPAVATPLLLLLWIHRGLSNAEISLLLRSDCIAGRGSADRSRLDLALRSLPDRAWTPRSLRLAQQGLDERPDLAGWFRGLDASIALLGESTDEASPARWASRIDSFLDEWNWPGERALDSIEFQLINRWRDLLNELAGTAVVTPKIRLREAVRRLASRAAEVVYQPEAESGVVSLMGTLEAAGLQFDHAWLSGLHAGLWPASGGPSPLLSRQLQRESGMPDATPADTLRFSRRVLRRLTSGAASVVLSWPRNDGESDLAPSSVLDELVCVAYAGPGDPGWHAAAFCGQNATAIVSDDPAPAVTEDEIVRGGAYTVQRQSVEPFAAFVYGRLGVTRLEAIETGISPSLRGNIIHNALCTLFSDHPAQAEVANWDAANISRRLGSAIDTAMADHLRYADQTLTRLLALERTRLFRLLNNFIAAEVERSAYTVSEVEKSVDFNACGVRLSLRIDRIDRLPDGSLLVIDYKTGAPRSLLDRDGDPRDLQLVVYADALQEAIGGLALINLDSRAISYKGTGGSVEWDVRRREEWPQRLAAWRANVHRALRGLAAGDARINLLLSADERRPLSILSRTEEHNRAQ